MVGSGSRYARVYLSVLNDPKFRPLQLKLRCSRSDTLGVLTMLWCYMTGSHPAQGWWPANQNSHLAELAGWTPSRTASTVGALTASGWIHEVERKDVKGYQVHNWEDWNAKINHREKAQTRQIRHRAKVSDATAVTERDSHALSRFAAAVNEGGKEQTTTTKTSRKKRCVVPEQAPCRDPTPTAESLSPTSPNGDVPATSFEPDVGCLLFVPEHETAQKQTPATKRAKLIEARRLAAAVVEGQVPNSEIAAVVALNLIGFQIDVAKRQIRKYSAKRICEPILALTLKIANPAAWVTTATDLQWDLNRLSDEEI